MALRALVTGGAGFIGSHLVEHLLQHNYHVTIIDDLSTGKFENIAHLTTHPNFRYALDDVRHFPVTDRLVSECDVIFHLAAAVGVKQIIEKPIHSIEVNIGATEVLLKAARRYRKKMLLASTSEVYGKGVSFPFHEDDDCLIGATTRSRWGYATSKALDEFLAFAYHQEAQLPVVIFRLFNTVGPRQRGQYGMVLPRFVQWALKNEPIQVYGDGQQARCFASVFDAIDAIRRLAETDTAIGQVVNIGNNEEVTILALAERVKARANSSSPIQLIPYEEAYNSGFEDFRRRVPSLTKIEQLSGWRPTTSLDAIIDSIIAYYQERS